MNDFIVICELPEYMDEEFINLIPKHRAVVNRLLEEGKLKSYSLAFDRSKLWIVVLAADENEVETILESMPLHSYLPSYEIQPLMFSQTSYQMLPVMSLN